MRQVVERGDDVPAVHLALVDLLRAVIEAGRVAQAHRIGGGEEAEHRVRADDPALVEQGELALHFEHALDDEHHIRAARVIFVEHQGAGMLQRPGEDALAEFGDLLAILQHDGVLADQVDTADVAVQVHPDAGPVQARRHLLDMGGFAGAVIALDHHAAIMGEAGADRQRRLTVELIGGVELRHVFGAEREGGHHHVHVDAEDIARIHRGVGHIDHAGGADVGQCGYLVHRDVGSFVSQGSIGRKPAPQRVCDARANRRD